MSSFSHNNRTCLVCKLAYQYCGSCPEYSHLEPWHAMFHDDNCRSIFYVAFDYDNNKITQKEAQEKFNKCDLSNKDNFSDVIKKSIKKAFNSNNIEHVTKTSETENVSESEQKEVQKPIKISSRRRGK